MHPSVLEVQAVAVKVALKEEMYQYLRKIKLSATTMTMMRTGQSASTLPGRHLIFKFEFHLMFQYPARKWFGVTVRRAIARTGLGASIA